MKGMDRNKISIIGFHMEISLQEMVSSIILRNITMSLKHSVGQ